MTRIQNDITPQMRAILLDWIIDVHFKLGMRSETLFLTANLIDRFLEKVQISRQCLQLVGNSPQSTLRLNFQ